MGVIFSCLFLLFSHYGILSGINRHVFLHTQVDSAWPTAGHLPTVTRILVIGSQGCGLLGAAEDTHPACLSRMQRLSIDEEGA